MKVVAQKLHLQPIRVTACYWKVKQAGEFSSSSFPCFIDSRSIRGEGHDVYSLPAEEYPGLIKVNRATTVFLQLRALYVRFFFIYFIFSI